MRERKIAMVVNQIKIEDEDKSDVLFWQNKSVSERLAEVVRLRKSYFSNETKSFPTKIEKVVQQKRL